MLVLIGMQELFVQDVTVMDVQAVLAGIYRVMESAILVLIGMLGQVVTVVMLQGVQRVLAGI